MDLKGGVCYFLWDRDHAGDCASDHSLRDESSSGRQIGGLDEHDVFIRDE